MTIREARKALSGKLEFGNIRQILAVRMLVYAEEAIEHGADSIDEDTEAQDLVGDLPPEHPANWALGSAFFECYGRMR